MPSVRHGNPRPRGQVRCLDDVTPATSPSRAVRGSPRTCDAAPRARPRPAHPFFGAEVGIIPSTASELGSSPLASAQDNRAGLSTIPRAKGRRAVQFGPSGTSAPLLRRPPFPTSSPAQSASSADSPLSPTHRRVPTEEPPPGRSPTRRFLRPERPPRYPSAVTRAHSAPA